MIAGLVPGLASGLVSGPASALMRDPLQPTPGEARDLLRRELVKPEYHDDNLVQRVLDWIGRRIGSTVASASGTPPLTWLAATAIAVGLALGLIYLVSRARRTERRRSEREALLTDEVISAAALRERAGRALAEGRYVDAVVDGFRALALAQSERGRLDDAPGATAHEVAGALGAAFPDQRNAVAASADVFDAVRYGERPATYEQAAAILAIDDALRSGTGR